MANCYNTILDYELDKLHTLVDANFLCRQAQKFSQRRCDRATDILTWLISEGLTALLCSCQPQVTLAARQALSHLQPCESTNECACFATKKVVYHLWSERRALPWLHTGIALQAAEDHCKLSDT